MNNLWLIYGMIGWIKHIKTPTVYNKFLAFKGLMILATFNTSFTSNKSKRFWNQRSSWKTTSEKHNWFWNLESVFLILQKINSICFSNCNKRMILQKLSPKRRNNIINSNWNFITTYASSFDIIGISPRIHEC